VTTWWRAGGVCTAALLASSSAGSCSLAFELDRQQCAENADCDQFANAECKNNLCVEIAEVGGAGGAGGSEPNDPKWACLGDVMPPDPGGDMIIHTYRFELATASPGTVPANLMIDLCLAIDTLCAGPIDSPVPDSNGTIVLELGVSEDAFLTVTSTETMPTLVFLQQPIVIPQSEKVIRMIGMEAFEGLVGAAGQTWDQTRGAAVVITNNCLDERAAGVRVESLSGDGDTVAFHFKGALPDPSSLQTDEQGAAGFLNMPAGVAGVDTYRASTDEFIGSGSFQSRAGTISYLPIAPTAAE